MPMQTAHSANADVPTADEDCDDPPEVTSEQWDHYKVPQYVEQKFAEWEALSPPDANKDFSYW